MFDYRLLEAFAAVITEKGFERGSEKLGLTQSAVSQRVKLLEELTGQVLVKRSNPPEVTASGLKLLRHFRKVMFLENEYLFSEKHDGFIKFPVGVNADSLGSWFLPAVGDFIKKRNLLLEVVTDDQSKTDLLLKNGEVLGCITSSPKTVQGCRSVFLGVMRYIAVSTPSFRDRYFPDGFTSDSLTISPAVFFNRSDRLLDQLLKDRFQPDFKKIPVTYIPSYEMFMQSIVIELGYGIIPEIQAEQLLSEKILVDISPGHYIDLKLYWHCWNIESPLIEEFSKNLVEKSGSALR